MLAGGMYYPLTCKPEDVLSTIELSHKNYFFIDVQSRGYYPNYALKEFERNGFNIPIQDDDEEILNLPNQIEYTKNKLIEIAKKNLPANTGAIF